jgi:hypothetical protein
MGYYVNIESCYSPNDIFIKKENFVEAYENLCWINTNPEFDVMKSGGSYSSEGGANSPRPDGFDYHPSKWYSWMSSDYHIKLKDLKEVLLAVGFEFDENENGISSLYYNNKTGNEDIFLCALAPFIENDSKIVWVGEDSERWMHSFKHGKMFFHKSKVVFSKEGKWISLLGHKKTAEKQNDFFASLASKMTTFKNN